MTLKNQWFADEMVIFQGYLELPKFNLQDTKNIKEPKLSDVATEVEASKIHESRECSCGMGSA